MRYAVIEGERIVQTGECPDELLELQAGPGQVAVAVDAGIRDDSYYWDGSAIQPLPPRPTPEVHWVWSGGVWTDPRSPADIEAEMDERRAAASMPRGAFILACMSVNILDPAEAAIAARGDIPPAFQGAVDQMSAQEQAELAVRWPALTQVERMDPFLLQIAATKGISVQTLDAAFGLADFQP